MINTIKSFFYQTQLNNESTASTFAPQNDKNLINVIKENKRGETIITGTLNRLGNANIYSAAYKYSLIQVNNSIITDVFADNFVVSFLELGRSYTFKIYKFFPIRKNKVLFSIENENGKYKIRLRVVLNILLQYNTLYLFVGLFTILAGSAFLSLFFAPGTAIVIAIIIHLIQVLITNYKIIKAYINS